MTDDGSINRMFTHAVMREYLSRNGCKETLAAFDREMPRDETSLGVRSEIARGLHLERLIKHNKLRETPYRSMMEMMVEFFYQGKHQSKEKDRAAVKKAHHKHEGASATTPAPLPQRDLEPASVPVVAEKVKASSAAPFDAVKVAPRPKKESGPVVVDLGASGRGTGPPPARKATSWGLGGGDEADDADVLRNVGERQAVRGSAAPVKKQNDDMVLEELGDEDEFDVVDMPKASRPAGSRPAPSAPVASSAVKELSVCATSYALSGRTVGDLRKLMYGDVSKRFPESYMQGLYFQGDRVDPELRYGLYQAKGGPCGVLAAVQAACLKALLFSSYKSPDDSLERLRNTTASGLNRVLAKALTEILWRAGGEKSAAVVLRTASAAASGLPAGYKNDSVSEYLTVYEFSAKDDLRKFLASNLGHFTRETDSAAVILVIYSAVLSRGGVAAVARDMDAVSNTFIGDHGYCTLDLVNLLLTGKASSNVHDGVKVLDGEMSLGGIESRADAGLLTLYEHYKSLEVGKHYKCPKYPIWLIHSESHFSIAFAVDRDIERKSRDKFDLYYYDGLAHWEETFRLTVDISSAVVFEADDFTSAVENCLRCKWPTAEIDWNGSTVIM